MAEANKTFVSQGICGYAYWDVINHLGLDPAILSYVLSFQDNRNFQCGSSSAPSNSGPASSGSDSAGVIIGSIALVGVVGGCIAATVAWRKYGHLFQQWKLGFRSL